MPINIPLNLPATEVLANENIFVMSEDRATHQDIRPLRIAIVNLMPTKIATETQLLRLLSNSPLQVSTTLIRVSSYVAKNTSEEHLTTFYKTFDEVRDQRYDGLIITGAPVEHLPFTEVDYWQELTQIMDWSLTHVYSTLHICWGAQAALYYHYGIPKYPLDTKQFGVFAHRVIRKNTMLLRGFDDVFYAPHSRHTEIRREDIDRVPDLEVLAESDEAGVYIVKARDKRHIFVTGHSEYDPMTLKSEYDRDISRGLPIAVPHNYFENDDPKKMPVVTWRSHANLLFANWLNYHVYQETPFDIDSIEGTHP